MFVFMDKYEKVSINSLCYPFLPGALTALCKLCQEKRDLLKVNRYTFKGNNYPLFSFASPRGSTLTGKQNAPVGADSKIRPLLERFFLLRSKQ